MKIIDLENHVYDKIVIYRDNHKSDEGEFIDLYKGDFKKIPSEMLDLQVRIISAKRKGILDIQVD